MGGKSNGKLVPKEGYNVRLVTIALEDCYGNNDDPQPQIPGSEKVRGSGEFFKYGDHFMHHQVSENDPDLLKILQAVVDEFQPDVLVGVNLYPSHLATKLRFNGVFWADMNGWTMAKAQMDAHKTGSDWKIGKYLRLEESVLARADYISVVSEAQKYAVVGELAMMKRLGREEFEKDFVVTIENGLEDFETDKIRNIVKTVRKPPSVENAWSAGTFEEVEEEGLRYFRGENSFSGADIPQNAFVVLWLGSYSSWVDEETLFKGVEAAMESLDPKDSTDSAALDRRPVDAKGRRKVYFVSTGGLNEESKVHESVLFSETANKNYLRFKEMVSLSRFKDRFVFLGWVPAKHIPYLYKESDVGINVDRKCLETMTGSRNRLLEMMKFNLPVITTLGTELSFQMKASGACICTKSGSVDELRDAVVELYRNPARRKDYGDKGRKYVDQYCSYDRVMGKFKKFVEMLGMPADGFASPDRQHKSSGFERAAVGSAIDTAMGTAMGVAKNLSSGSRSLLKSASDFFKKKTGPNDKH